MPSGPGMEDLLPPISQQDLAFLNADLEEVVAIAQRGDGLPLMAGSITAWWGFLLTATNFYQMLAYLHLGPPPMPTALIQVPLGYLGTFLLMRHDRKHRTMLAWRTHSIAATWLFSGLIIMVFMVGVIVTGAGTTASANVFLCLIFAINFGAMAASRHTNWLVICAFGWILGAVLTFAVQTTPYLLSLVFGSCSLAFMLVPGLVLRQQKKRAVA